MGSYSSVKSELISFKNREEEEEAFAEASMLRGSGIFANVLNAAIDLGLFDIIAKLSSSAEAEGGDDSGGFVSAAEIASQLPNCKNPDAADLINRMLRLLSCHSLLTCSSSSDDGDGAVQRRYCLAPVGKVFVSREDGRSLAFLKPLKPIEMVWLHLKDFVLEGGNLFEMVNGMPIYDYMSLHPDMSESFNKSMSNLSNITMEKVIETYKGFEGLSSLVDVGGGTGASLKIIVSKYPSIKAINFDAPHVIQNAPSYPGIEHVGGDMFSSIPKADAMMMKNILHNWNDEQCIKVLRNCREALPKNGKLIVLSWVNSEEPDSSRATKYLSCMDILMFMNEGKQRTKKEFNILSKAAGFSHFQLNCSAYFVGVMEFFK